jgi:miniconductance mechanosensitive channel
METSATFTHWTEQWLRDAGLLPQYLPYASLGIDLLLLALLALLLDLVARRVIMHFVSRYVKRSKNAYDDIFLEKKVFQSLAHLLPTLVFYFGLPVVFEQTGLELSFLQQLLIVYLIIVIVQVVQKFLRSLETIGLQSSRFEGKPVSSYIQVGLILVYITAAIFIISTLVGRSAVAVLTTFGAATAVILLIFRDTILGFVASIQIASNDILRLGDWVSMDKYGADGDVIAINLTTVKVRNFDKTITTVPTYAFISDSFRNWRGMQSLGIRRIMRSLHIDLNSIDFIGPEMYQRYRRYDRVSAYLESRQQEIDADNQNRKVDKTALINGRNLTNIGVFRQYVLAYLQQHPQISQQETIMVRQLEPTDRGLPLQVYCFSTDINWVNYEAIQSDLMDHLLAAVEYFDLRLFQNPSGRDLKELTARR